MGGIALSYSASRRGGEDSEVFWGNAVPTANGEMRPESGVSFAGPSIRLEGSLRFSGKFLLNGSLKGEVEGRGLLEIGERGRVEGRLRIEDLVHRGESRGGSSRRAPAGPRGWLLPQGRHRGGAGAGEPSGPDGRAPQNARRPARHRPPLLGEKGKEEAGGSGGDPRYRRPCPDRLSLRCLQVGAGPYGLDGASMDRTPRPMAPVPRFEGDGAQRGAAGQRPFVRGGEIREGRLPGLGGGAALFGDRGGRPQEAGGPVPPGQGVGPAETGRESDRAAQGFAPRCPRPHRGAGVSWGVVPAGRPDNGGGAGLWGRLAPRPARRRAQAASRGGERKAEAAGKSPAGNSPGRAFAPCLARRDFAKNRKGSSPRKKSPRPSSPCRRPFPVSRKIHACAIDWERPFSPREKRVPPSPS